jgi:hypothetical protein
MKSPTHALESQLEPNSQTHKSRRTAQNSNQLKQLKLQSVCRLRVLVCEVCGPPERAVHPSTGC